MTFKNICLAAKTGLGFTILSLIMTGLGWISMVNMDEAGTQIRLLPEGLISAVETSTEVERLYQQTVFRMTYIQGQLTEESGKRANLDCSIELLISSV